MPISKCPELEDFKGSYAQLRKGFGARALLITSVVSSGFPRSAFLSKNCLLHRQSLLRWQWDSAHTSCHGYSWKPHMQSQGCEHTFNTDSLWSQRLNPAHFVTPIAAVRQKRPQRQQSVTIYRGIYFWKSILQIHIQRRNPHVQVHKHQDGLGSCISKSLRGSDLYKRILAAEEKERAVEMEEFLALSWTQITFRYFHWPHQVT